MPLTPFAVPRDRLRQPMLAWEMSPASGRPVMLPQRSRGLPPDSESELPDDAAEVAASPRTAPAGPAAASDQARRKRLSVDGSIHMPGHAPRGSRASSCELC